MTSHCSERATSCSDGALPPDSSRTFWFVPSGDTALHITFRVQHRNVDGGEHGYLWRRLAPKLLQQ
jgi:hypothetical protein